LQQLDTMIYLSGTRDIFVEFDDAFVEAEKLITE